MRKKKVKFVPKLNEDDVKEIVERLSAGEKNADLCKRYNVHRNTISGIARKNGASRRRTQTICDGKVRRMVLITKDQDEFVNKQRICMSDLVSSVITHIMKQV